jgi:hypothetical protein
MGTVLRGYYLCDPPLSSTGGLAAELPHPGGSPGRHRGASRTRPLVSLNITRMITRGISGVFAPTL